MRMIGAQIPSLQLQRKEKRTLTRKKGRVFACGEDTHTLRLENELSDLRVGYVHRHPLALKRTGPSLNPKPTAPKERKKDTHTECPFFFGGAGRI